MKANMANITANQVNRVKTEPKEERIKNNFNSEDDCIPARFSPEPDPREIVNNKAPPPRKKFRHAETTQAPVMKKFPKSLQQKLANKAAKTAALKSKSSGNSAQQHKKNSQNKNVPASMETNKIVDPRKFPRIPKKSSSPKINLSTDKYPVPVPKRRVGIAAPTTTTTQKPLKTSASKENVTAKKNPPNVKNEQVVKKRKGDAKPALL